MNIANISEKINSFLVAHFRIITIVLLAVLGFGIYQFLSHKEPKTPLQIITLAQNADGSFGQSQAVVASKTGTKYYLPWCGTLSRIKPENRVQFASPALARAAGYTPAANCKGTK